MSLHYLLDGYNILHQMPLLKLQKIDPFDSANALLRVDPEQSRRVEDERFNLVRHIERNRPQGSPANRITIVFDGYGNADERLNSSTVKVVLSQGRSADEVIKDMVSSSDNKKTIIVVTNDRAIQYAVRAEGAKVCKVDEFLGKMSPAKTVQQTKTVKKDKDNPKNISHVMEHKINSEFENIWIKKKDEKS